MTGGHRARWVGSLALSCVLGASAPALGDGSWTEPQTLMTAPATDPRTTLAETADGTVVAMARGSDGVFRRASRLPGGEWVPGGEFQDPDGLSVRFGDAFSVTSDGAGWLAYSPTRANDVRIVRWAPGGTSAVLDEISKPWTGVDLAVDDESDVVLTYGDRGGFPLNARYGDADGLVRLDVISWSAAHRPHQWVLGPGDDVMLASRVGNRIRAVDLGPEGAGDTELTLDRKVGTVAGEVAAAIAPSGAQYVAWTTAPEGGPRTLWMARRPPDGDWLPSRVVDRRGTRSRPQRALELRATTSGAYLAWIQPVAEGIQVRGALVRKGRPVQAQAVAEYETAGGSGAPRRLVVQVSARGRLLVAWTASLPDGPMVSAALGRVRGVPVVTQLFEVDAQRGPVALLRSAGEGTVASTYPSTVGDDVLLRTASTD